MKYLLDAHTFMWWDANSSNLTPRIHNIISDDKNTIYLSVVSTWEMSIKVQVGKLLLHDDLSVIVANQIEKNDILVLPISLAHTLKIAELPLHHKDPFDRLLIAQAIVEDMTLLSKDSVFTQYDAKVIW